MDDVLQQQEREEMLEGLEYYEGYEFYQKSLEVDPSFYQSEADFKISRFEKWVTMSDEDKQRLKDNAPPEPGFAVMSESKVKKMNCVRRKRYKRKVNAYRSKRAAWENDEEKSAAYYGVIGSVGARVNKAKSDEEERQARLQNQAASNQRVAAAKGTDRKPLYRDIQANVADMNAALMRMTIEENAKKEKEIGARDLDAAILPCGPEEYQRRRLAFTAYVNGCYVAMNEYMRKDVKSLSDKDADFVGENVYELTDMMKEMMRPVRINRDIVVRRGVGGIDTLSFMFDKGKSVNLSQEAFVANLREAFKKETILTDKGFVSTSIRAGAGFPAGYKNPDNMGIEFIILVKKGTRALDVAGAGLLNQAANEEELIIGNGTKFRVVRAYFNDGKDEQHPEDGEDAGVVLKGPKKCWKIYLETIPESETGVLRDAA